VTPGYALVEFSTSVPEPEVTHIPIEARPMKTIAPVDSQDRSAREISDIVLDRVAKFVDPAAMARVELRNVTRPVRREVESILRRESQGLCWHLQVYSRGDVLATPGDPVPASESTDIRSLFEEFLVVWNYEPTFASAFGDRGRRALDDAFRAQDAAAPEDGAA
jgi:hypothetical protein